MKDAYYFPHDSNATNDTKVMLMIAQWGLEAYGIYWTLIEHLRDQPGYRSHLTICRALASRFQSSEEKYLSVVKSFGLFEVEDDHFFFSSSLRRRMEPLEYRRQKAIAAGKASGRARRERSFNGRSTDAEPSKVKYSKVKERKKEEDKEKEAAEKSAHTIEQRRDVFIQSLQNFGAYPPDMLTAFADYWTEHNQHGKKMRFEMQKVFDISRRLKTWERNENENFKHGQRKSKYDGLG